MFRGKGKNDRGAASGGTPAGHLDDWEALATDYVDGRLDLEARTAIESHLLSCPDCSARVQAQLRVATFLHDTPFEEPPVGMEDRVLGEVLFPLHPPEPSYQASPGKPSRWPTLWRRRIRPWIPATVAVTALLLAVLTYGLLRSDLGNVEEAAQTTSTSSTLVAREGAAAGQETVLGDTTTALAAASEDSAAQTTTTAAAGTTTETTAAQLDVAAEQDRKTMISSFESAESPVYFVFEAAAPSQTVGSTDTSSTTVPGQTSSTQVAVTLSLGQTQEIVTQITAFTGLLPLDSALDMDGPTFAAYVPREDAAELVDLLRSIGASLTLAVGLRTAPPAKGSSDYVGRLMERKTEYPELSASRMPQPAVTGWSFTTSTLVPPDYSPDQDMPVMPDEAGTHVLVVICIWG